jgi:methylmalonyl-CoA/ethylmalonyl-CoA epimerase
MPAMITAVTQISINAKDLARATAFYRDRLGLRHLFDAPPSMSFFECGSVRLMIGKAEAGEFDHPSSILYYRVEDLEGDCAKLRDEGVRFRAEPHLVAKLPDREIWMAFLEDTEGNVLALTSERGVGSG